MATIIHPVVVDPREVASAIKNWLDFRHFETKALEAGGCYFVKARKASAVRAIFGADRALEIQVGNADGKTIVDVRQGSWATNAVSNLGWLLVCGGMNLAFSGWSVVVQKELESYIRSVLAELSGAHEVDLRTGAAVPPVIGGSFRPDAVSDAVSSLYAATLGRPREICFVCSNCGQSILIDASGAGLEVDCPTCNAKVTVPS